MKEIRLVVEVHEDPRCVSWTLDDWKGTVSKGRSTDSADNLAHLWTGDIAHVLEQERKRARDEHAYDDHEAAVDLAWYFDWMKENPDG